MTKSDKLVRKKSHKLVKISEKMWQTNVKKSETSEKCHKTVNLSEKNYNIVWKTQTFEKMWQKVTN